MTRLSQPCKVVTTLWAPGNFRMGGTGDSGSVVGHGAGVGMPVTEVYSIFYYSLY